MFGYNRLVRVAKLSVTEAGMALTAEEMINIRELLEDVITRRVDPRFEQMDVRFEQMDARFDALEQRFDDMHDQVQGLQEDVVVVKEMVKDHSFEIARIKHRTA
jgi:acyl carrier protein phosphodiesterase